MVSLGRICLFLLLFPLFLGDRLKKSIAMIYVKESSAYVFLQEFYDYWSYI